MWRKSTRTARTKFKVAGSKSFKAATSTSEQPPSPKAGGRKCPPEESVALEKLKGKVTTLWQREKPMRVVIVDVPTGKDTGPPLNKNGISFCNQCNIQFHSPLSAQCNLCCDRHTHVSLNSLTPKSVPAGTKLVLFGRYVLNIYVGIVRYFLRKTKTQRAKIYLPTQRTNRRISYDIN